MVRRSLLPIPSIYLLLAACAGPDPSEALRTLIAEAEQAAEARDTGHFRALISDDYADASGRSKQDLVAYLRAYFFANADIEVLNRIEEVELFGDDAAELTLQSALIGRGPGRSALGVDGDLYRLSVELVRDGGDWQIIGADWERILQ